MNWNELYEKNKSRKYREIKEIKNNMILKARVINFVKLHSKILPITLIVIALLLILAFYSNLKMLLLAFFMYIIILFLSIYFNTFTIICKQNKMIIKMNMQEINIDYSNIKNIYLDKKQNRIFIKKHNYFSLILLYETPTGNISNIDFPVLFLKPSDVQKFLNNFALKEDKSNNIQKAQHYNLKRLLIKIALFILVWVLIILSLIIKMH